MSESNEKSVKKDVQKKDEPKTIKLKEPKQLLHSYCPSKSNENADLGAKKNDN